MQTPDKNLGVRKNLFELEFRFMTPDNKPHNPTQRIEPTRVVGYRWLLQQLGHNAQFPIVID